MMFYVLILLDFYQRAHLDLPNESNTWADSFVHTQTIDAYLWWYCQVQPTDERQHPWKKTLIEDDLTSWKSEKLAFYRWTFILVQPNPTQYYKSEKMEDALFTGNKWA